MRLAHRYGPAVMPVTLNEATISAMIAVRLRPAVPFTPVDEGTLTPTEAAPAQESPSPPASLRSGLLATLPRPLDYLPPNPRIEAGEIGGRSTLGLSGVHSRARTRAR